MLKAAVLPSETILVFSNMTLSQITESGRDTRYESVFSNMTLSQTTESGRDTRSESVI